MEDNKKLIIKALESVEDSSFECLIASSPDENITCGSDKTDIELSARQLNYLISQIVDAQLLPTDLEKEKVDIEKLIADAAYAFYMEDDAEYYEGCECRGTCPYLENYLNGWKDLIDLIDRGEVSEEELPTWLEYFDTDTYNLEYSSISEWVEMYGDID